MNRLHKRVLKLEFLLGTGPAIRFFTMESDACSENTCFLLVYTPLRGALEGADKERTDREGADLLAQPNQITGNGFDSR